MIIARIENLFEFKRRVECRCRCRCTAYGENTIKFSLESGLSIDLDSKAFIVIHWVIIHLFFVSFRIICTKAKKISSEYYSLLDFSFIVKWQYERLMLHFRFVKNQNTYLKSNHNLLDYVLLYNCIPNIKLNNARYMTYWILHS